MVRGVAMAACVAVSATLLAAAGPACAEPDPADPTVQQVAAADPAVGVVPVDDGKVASSAPETSKTPDGWTITISAKDETQRAVAPLTTAISTREYLVGGVFNGSLKGGETTPKGVFEVGYQIGCGIDMSTSNGVTLAGTAGINPSIGFLGIDNAGPGIDGILPGVGANITGAVTVGLKPGIINYVPITKKEYKSSEPWVSITNFRIKIDGCVGESFIRSYAVLSKSNDSGDAIMSWYGVTKKV